MMMTVIKKNDVFKVNFLTDNLLCDKHSTFTLPFLHYIFKLPMWPFNGNIITKPLKWRKLMPQYISSVQLLSRVWLCWDPMDCSTPGLLVHHQLSEFTQTHVHWASDAIQPSHPLSSPSLPAFNLSQHQGLFKWVTSSHEVAKVLEFQLQCQSFQWILGLISFRMDWLDLLTVQGILKSLLQHHHSKASILQRSAFFTVQLSHPTLTWPQEKP